MKKIALLLLLFCASAQAANIHCGPSATGSGTGVDWNNKAAFASVSLARGNTYYLADGSYSGKVIAVANSGTSRIIIQKATTASHGSATGWNNADGDDTADIGQGFNIDDCGYVTIDGQFEYGIRLIIGTSDRGIFIGGFTGGVIRNDIQIKYTEIAGPAGSAAFLWTAANASQGIWANIFNPPRAFIDDLLISHCYIHGFETLIQTSYTRRAILEYTKLSDSRTSSTNYQVDPHPNVWFNQLGDDTICRYNEMWNWANTGFYPSEGGTNHKYYGNYFHDAAPGAPNGIQMVPHASNLLGTYPNVQIYNNTFVNVWNFNGGPIDIAYPGTTVTGTVKNNLFFATGTLGIISYAAGVTHDYNWYSGTDKKGEINGIAAGSTNPWSVQPQISSTIGLLYPRNKGQAQVAEFNTDPLGIIRGSGDGAWDIGAYETGGATDTTPPTASSASVPAAGNQITLTASEAVQIGAGGNGGLAASLSGGAVTLTFSSVSGSSVIYTTSRTINSGETGTVSYTQPSNGIEDLALNDLATFSGLTVTNGSTQNAVATPDISLVSGAYYGTQSVTLATATSGATIYYTTNGVDPTTGSAVYSGAIALSAPTVVKAIAVKSGLANSPVATASYAINAWTGGTTITSFAVPQQTGAFTWNFEATPTSTTSDTVICMGPAPITAFSGGGPIILFDTDGTIKARNGTGYAAVNVLNVVASTKYTFAVTGTVNGTTNTYSVTCTPAAGSPTVIATNYAFRETQAAAAELDNVGLFTNSGTTLVENMTFTVAPVGPVINAPQNLRISDP